MSVAAHTHPVEELVGTLSKEWHHPKNGNSVAHELIRLERLDLLQRLLEEEPQWLHVKSSVRRSPMRYAADNAHQPSFQRAFALICNFIFSHNSNHFDRAEFLEELASAKTELTPHAKTNWIKEGYRSKHASKNFLLTLLSLLEPYYAVDGIVSSAYPVEVRRELYIAFNKYYLLANPREPEGASGSCVLRPMSQNSINIWRNLSRASNEELVEFVDSNAVDVNKKLLRHLLLKGRIDAILYLNKARPKAVMELQRGTPLLIWAIPKRVEEDTLRSLLPLTDLTWRNGEGLTLAHELARQGECEWLFHIIGAGFDATLLDSKNITVLRYAHNDDDSESFQQIIEGYLVRKLGERGILATQVEARIPAFLRLLSEQVAQMAKASFALLNGIAAQPMNMDNVSDFFASDVNLEQPLSLESVIQFFYPLWTAEPGDEGVFAEAFATHILEIDIDDDGEEMGRV